MTDDGGLLRLNLRRLERARGRDTGQGESGNGRIVIRGASCAGPGLRRHPRGGGRKAEEALLGPSLMHHRTAIVTCVYLG